MKQFKVKKGINKEPLLWGMKIPLFILFMISLVIAAFTLIGGFTIVKVVVVGVSIGILFLGCQMLSKYNWMKIFFSEQFPDSIKNNRF